MNHPAIQITDLDFSYGKNNPPCFESLNLKVSEGERFGLFGPNGAGKTTLISCMTGVLSYKHGSISIFGHELNKDPDLIKKMIGFVPQDLAFYEELSPAENFEFFGALAGMNKPDIKKKTEELLHIFGLEDVANKQTRKFSGGMKRKVNLAIGVVHRPKLLFLDEPTVGVDVQTRHVIINFLKELNKQGTTLVYTSHQLSEAEALCDKIVLIDKGKIIAIGSPSELFTHHGEEDLEGLFIKLTGKDMQQS